MDLLKDVTTGEFKGQVNVEFEDELEAKKGFTGLMGFKIEEKVLFVKRLTTVSAPTT